MSLSSNMYIRFIRKNGQAETDDLVTIQRVNRNIFRCSFRDGNTKKTETIVLNDRNLFWWLRIILRLVKKDSEPFKSIQFDMPMMPSVLVNIRKIDDFYHTLLDAVEFHLDNWPTEIQKYGDIYGDMPSLVSQVPVRTTTI